MKLRVAAGALIIGMCIFIIGLVVWAWVVLIINLAQGRDDPAELHFYIYPPQDAQKVEQIVTTEGSGKPLTCDELFDLASEPLTVEEFESSNYGQLVPCVD